MYLFPSFAKEGILCYVVGHVERERERERERYLGFQDKHASREREGFRVPTELRRERERERERERREVSEKSRVVCKIHRDSERRRSRAGSERVGCRGSVETWQAPQRMPPKMPQRIPSLTSSRTMMSSRSLRTKVRAVKISLITGFPGKIPRSRRWFFGSGFGFVVRKGWRIC